jgi:hypothetical protein
VALLKLHADHQFGGLAEGFALDGRVFLQAGHPAGFRLVVGALVGCFGDVTLSLADDAWDTVGTVKRNVIIAHERSAVANPLLAVTRAFCIGCSLFPVRSTCRR